MDDILIIDEFEIETETDLYNEGDIFEDQDIELLGISVVDVIEDISHKDIFETELLEVQTETVAADPETELLEVQTETVAADPETELLEVQTETVAADPETELLEVQSENLHPETESINIENIASEHLESLGVLHETGQDIKVDKIISDQQVIQEEVLSDNKEIKEEDPEEESEFSFVELVKNNSEKEILGDGSNTDNTIYDIDDIYNLISLRIPENSRLFTSKRNIDDIYNLLSDSMSVDLLSTEHVRSVDDNLDIVEVVEESKTDSNEVEESESETTSIDDIYNLIDQQNKILLSNQEIQIAILQNQKTISDNDNKMNTFIVSGIFAILGAVVISNLFRGIK